MDLQMSVQYLKNIVNKGQVFKIACKKNLPATERACVIL